MWPQAPSASRSPGAWLLDAYFPGAKFIQLAWRQESGMETCVWGAGSLVFSAVVPHQAPARQEFPQLSVASVRGVAEEPLQTGVLLVQEC